MKYNEGDVVTIVKPSGVSAGTSYKCSTSGSTNTWTTAMDILIGQQYTLVGYPHNGGWRIHSYGWLEDWMELVTDGKGPADTLVKDSKKAYEHAMGVIE